MAATQTLSPQTQTLLAEMEAAVMFTAKRPPVVMARGRGSWLWDVDGRPYLDFVQGWAVNALGHCPPVLARALSAQAKVLVNASPAFYNAPWIHFAQLLSQQSGLDKVFFTSTGAEANEGALKLARKYGAVKLNGAYEVITTHNAFHGRTLAMMSASGKAAWDKLFLPKVPGFVHVPFNDLAAVAGAITKNTCAIMVEPVQGEGGVHVADVAYIQGLRALCDQHKLLLILDEVQTGIGRVGSLFAYQQYQVLPDVLTLGKGLGGGFPVSATLCRNAYNIFEVGEQGGTFCAQPLAMVAGLAVVQEVIRRKLPQRAEQNGRYLMRGLAKLAPRFGLKNIRGKGLLIGVDLPQDKGADVVVVARELGLLLNSPQLATLRFMPALTVSRKEIDQALHLLAQALERVLI